MTAAELFVFAAAMVAYLGAFGPLMEWSARRAIMWPVLPYACGLAGFVVTIAKHATL